MKFSRALVIGHKGYLGKQVINYLREFESKIRIYFIDEKFQKGVSEEKYREVIVKNGIDIILNCAGSIDGNSQESSQKVLSAHLDLPIFLYRISQEIHVSGLNLRVIMISSTSKNAPRPKYPIYAACKSFEESLFFSATEEFANSSVEWKQITLPALSGGLRKIVQPNVSLVESLLDEKRVKKICEFALNTIQFETQILID